MLRVVALVRWRSRSGKGTPKCSGDVGFLCPSKQEGQPGPKHVRTAVATSWPLVMNASDPELKHFFAEGPMEAAYANTFLANMSGPQQGLILQHWARQTLQTMHPGYEFLDPKPGTCCNGQRRGAGTEAYDFLMEGRKVEIKSSRMMHDVSHKCWQIVFHGIKLPVGNQTTPAFDDLFLAIASPDCLILIQHDLRTGIASTGKRATWAGLQLKVRASVKDVGWKAARGTILEKLCEKGSCKLIAERFLDDVHLSELLRTYNDERDLGQTAYDGSDLGNMSAARRGFQIQKMGLVIDQKLNPHCCFRMLEGELTDSGQIRGVHRATADWMRSSTLVELKSSKLQFDKQWRFWKCAFCNLKSDCFDELWLAICSPWDVRFYKSNTAESLPLTSRGIRTEDSGSELRIHGPRGEEDLHRALEVIEGKLFSRGLVKQAIVEWEAAPRLAIHHSSSTGKWTSGLSRSIIEQVHPRCSKWTWLRLLQVPQDISFCVDASLFEECRSCGTNGRARRGCTSNYFHVSITQSSNAQRYAHLDRQSAYLEADDSCIRQFKTAFSHAILLIQNGSVSNQDLIIRNPGPTLDPQKRFKDKQFGGFQCCFKL